MQIKVDVFLLNDHDCKRLNTIIPTFIDEGGL